ncbi:MAG: hypothetical protein HQ579_08940 [Candidatus Omnitrophica bacterium]|nr:hypothetical protein [Candidatus Omnitrophota bacterium]
MNPLCIITGLFKALMLKVFPSFGYKGVVDTQIGIYGRAKQSGATEQKALNHLIVSRKRLLLGEEKAAEQAYGFLLSDNHKTLKDVIKAIIAYEYFDNAESKKLTSNMPMDAIEVAKKECAQYIDKRLSKGETI